MATSVQSISPTETNVGDQQKVPPGTHAPVSTPDADKQQDQGYGPNNEYLEMGRKDDAGNVIAEPKARLVAAIRELAREYRTEGIVSRRHEIRRIKQARLFWQGLQYNYGWDAQTDDFRMPFGNGGLGAGLTIDDDKDAQEGSRYTFVTNFFQAFGLSFISVMSQDVPTLQTFPQVAQNNDDIIAAKACREVALFVQENNRPDEILRDIGYFLWTDGKLGAYVRYLADGQRFGFHDSPTMGVQEQKIGDDAFNCPQCGTQTPPDQLFPGMICPSCGTQLTQDNFQEAPTAQVPTITSVQKLPNGQEVISIIGGLELNTPVWAQKQHEYPYLQWQSEPHKSQLRASYPHVADKILAGATVDAEDVYARASRLSVRQGLPTTHPGDALQNLPTFSRTWIRPWAFYALEGHKDDEAKPCTRCELLQMFPDGCYVAFAGETYCESRNENMDEHWRVMHGIPGDGQNRPAVGSSMISPQERYNILSNTSQESYEYGIPPIYADPQVLDFDAISGQTAEPGAHYPARAKPGRSLADGFFQPAAADVPQSMLESMNQLGGPIPEFLTGLFPAVFGGDMNDVKTASGYAMARDQAMGRLGLIWRTIKEFYAETMKLAIDAFRKNRSDDVMRAVLTDDGEYETKLIRMVDLKGNIQVRSEPDETFPRLKSQQRAALQQLMQLGDDPAIGSALTEPANLGYIKNLLGLNDLVIPGEDSRNKQLREITQLLQGPPMMVPGQPTPDGQPAQPQMISTVPVDVLDRHDVEFEECKRWANGEAGINAKMTNPAGFANVRAHAMEHQKALAALQSPQTKPPSESIAFKDLPPDGKMQMAEQAAIHLNPALLMAKEASDQQEKNAKMDALRNKKPPASEN